MKKPHNLLLLWTDQQRADTMACYGNEQIETPNLNRLGDESFVFRNAYCTQPVCTPSRASILTGLWPHTHGCVSNNVALSEGARTIAECLPSHYRSGYYGKWHLGDEIVPQRGFEDWVSIEDESYRPFYSRPELLDERSDYHRFLVKSGFYPDREAADGARIFSRPFAAGMAEYFTKAAFLGREAARFLRSQTADRPFCLSVNFLEPHPPTFGPLNHLYDPETLAVGEAFLKAPSEKAVGRLRIAHDRKMFGDVKIIKFMHYPLKTEWDWRRMMANYYGLVTLVDRAVGEILKALEDSGQAENTIVAFTSDHGEMLGDHRLLGKGVFFESSARIPLLVRVPWLSGEQRAIDGRFSQIDLLPTLLDLLEQQIPDGLQGRSRLPVFTGRESLTDNDVVVEWNDPKDPECDARSIISAEGWKLNLHRNYRGELYDLNDDPSESTNQFDSPSQASRVRDLRNRLAKWQSVNEDALSLPG